MKKMSEKNQKYFVGQTVTGTVTGSNSNAVYLEIEEGVKAVDTLRYNMELERDRVPESVYDSLVDIVTEISGYLANNRDIKSEDFKEYHILGITIFNNNSTYIIIMIKNCFYLQF